MQDHTGSYKIIKGHTGLYKSIMLLNSESVKIRFIELPRQLKMFLASLPSPAPALQVFLWEILYLSAWWMNCHQGDQKLLLILQIRIFIRKSYQPVLTEQRPSSLTINIFWMNILFSLDLGPSWTIRYVSTPLDLIEFSEFSVPEMLSSNSNFIVSGLVSWLRPV